MTTVSAYHVEVDGLQLSGLVAEPDGPARAFIVAVHGGSYSSRYFHLHATKGASALENYASLGFRVVALDRPGYGTATDIAPATSSFEAQAAIMRTAVAQAHADRGQGLPLFLVGHSIGGMIVMTMAAGHLDVPLRGVMASGLGMVWQPGMQEMWASYIGEDTHVPVPNEARNQIMFAADDTLIDRAVQEEAGEDLFPVPREELRDTVRWHETMPVVAAEIRVPVLNVLAEFDGLWTSDEHAQRQSAIAMQGIEGALVRVQRGAGHCLDAHRAGYAHRLETAAFFETYLVTRS